MRPVIGYPGIPGAFSEQAAEKLFGRCADYRGYDTFPDVMEGLIRNEIAYGVFPVENSTAGIVAETHDLLLREGVHIVGEICLPVVHCLLAPKGAVIEGIHRVHSHPQALSQCGRFLRSHGAMAQVPALNTAIAARTVAEKNTPEDGAIASEYAARRLGLSVLAKGIQDMAQNATRFVAVSRSSVSLAAPNKATLAFAVKDRPGALGKALIALSAKGINLTHIESRPIQDKPFEYLFYADMEGDFSEGALEKALEALSGHVTTVRLLGLYAKGDGRG